MMRRDIVSTVVAPGPAMHKRGAMRRMMVCAGLSVTVVSATLAALPPPYLAVKEFQKCLMEKDMGTYRAWCLPTAKPAACPRESWRQLRKLTGQDKVPAC